MSKQIPGQSQFLRSLALSKSILLDIYLSVEQDKGCLPYVFFKIYVIHLHKIQPSLQKAQLSVQVCNNSLYC